MPAQMEEPQKEQMSKASFKSWLGSWQEWGSVILLFLTLEIAVRSVEQVRWITPQPPLTVVLALAVLTTWLLCKSRLPAMATYPLALVLGAMLTVWQASNLLPPLETVSRVKRLIIALQSWWETMLIAKPYEGTIHFAVFLIFITWILGCVSTWFILRRQNAWVAVLLGATAILINLSNLPEQNYIFFFFYVLAALLLLGQTSLARQHYWFKKRDTIYPNRGIIYGMFLLLCLSILAVSVAWLTPEIRVNQLETVVNTKMSWRKNIEDHFTNFFAAIPAKQSFLKSSEQRELLFGELFGQGDELQFVIVSEHPHYWRMRTYDTYTSSGWRSSHASEQLLMPRIPITEAHSFVKLNEMRYNVAPKLKTDIVLTAGEFISTSTPVLEWFLAPLSLDIDLFASPDIEVTPTQIGRDVIAITTPNLLRAEQRYTVTTGISSATSDDLSEAGDEYPYWITDYYLQLPPTFPERVRQVSETVTEEAQSPYDKAVAIKQYLSQFDYSLEVEAPPQGVDGVDYFLSTQKSGNCVHFASAMAVMLRSVGVPSRLSAGYSPAGWDASTRSSALRAKNRHAWPEVYFPGYGWVEFEPTPAVDSELSELEEIAAAGGGVAQVWEDDEELMGIGLLEEGLGAGGGGTTSENRFGIILLFVIIMGITLFIYTLWSLRSRQRRRFMRPDYTSEVYRKMCFLASLLRLGPKPQQTPLEYGAKLAPVFPLQSEAIDNIVQAYVKSRFSYRKELGLLERGRLQKSWHKVYPVFIKHLFHLRH